jgi:transposase
MDTEVTITTERIDDFPLLLEMMIRAGLPEIIDRHLGRHGLHQGLSWGWIVSIWLAHLLTQSDHRKQPVQSWARQAKETIERISGQQVREMDFTDDRLTLLLRRVSKPKTWAAIENELGRNLLRVYDLQAEQVRLDTTTVSGYHAGGEESLFQYGYSKDDPSLRQIKLMVAALDPLGLLLVTQVLAGNLADDKLYTPAIDRVLQMIDRKGLLFVGDSKMSALATRAYIHRLGQHYLCPLAQTGETAQEMKQWVAVAGDDEHPLQAITIEQAKGERKLLAEGYVLERPVGVQAVMDQRDGFQSLQWTERVMVVRSEGYRKAQLEVLENHLQRAAERLQALTPLPGRGKRQIQDENELLSAATAILKAYEVEGLLDYSFERQEKHQTKYIGRGRGNPNRPKQEIVTVRYQITAVSRQAEAINAYRKTLGWRVFATNAPAEQLGLEQAVLAYRDEWLIERNFHRLKGVPLSLDPLFVKRDDQVAGLTNLLCIAVRFLTLIEFIVRRNLKQNHELLTGLIENNPKKGIDNPTTERLLKEFDEVTLTIVHLPNQIIRHVTPLTNLQTRILELLGFSASIYTRLADN